MGVRDILRLVNRKVLKRARRSRILIDKDRERVAIANYKCGFTSMNRCLAGWDKSIDEAGGLDRWLTDHPDATVHMIVRNPVIRFQSFVHDWLIDKGPVYVKRNEGRERKNFAYANLVTVLDQAAADRVAGFRESGDNEAIFRFLVEEVPLEDYLEKNEHTAAQSALVKIRGGGFLQVDHFYELDVEESMGEFSKQIGCEFPRSNPSSRKNDDVPSGVREKIREIYRDDYELFGSFLDGSRSA